MYTTVVGLHTSGQTQQNDLVFQLWACSTQKGGGNYHSAGEHRKVWTTNLKKQESKPNLYDALANPSNRGLHVDQKNLNRQEAVGEKKNLHFFGLMQYDSLSPLETLGSIQVWIVSGKNVSELRPVSSGNLSTLWSHRVTWWECPEVLREGWESLSSPTWKRRHLFCLPGILSCCCQKNKPKKQNPIKQTLEYAESSAVVLSKTKLLLKWLLWPKSDF